MSHLMHVSVGETDYVSSYVCECGERQTMSHLMYVSVGRDTLCLLLCM